MTTDNPNQKTAEGEVMIELRNRISDVLEAMDGDDLDSVSQAIIELLGMEETNTSRHNEMVKYETKWFPRSDEGADDE